MLKPWKILAILFLVEVAFRNTYGEDDFPMFSSENSGGGGSQRENPIAKGLAKLKLLDGVKKMHLQLAKMNFQKGGMPKLPFLGGRNPFKMEQNMDGTDSYYVGTPEAIGTPMWESQQLDSGYKYPQSRYEVPDNFGQGFMHENGQFNGGPTLGMPQDVEFLPGHFEGHYDTEPQFFRDDREQNSPNLYRSSPIDFRMRNFDSFEYEGPQETQYRSIKSNQPEDVFVGSFEQSETDTIVQSEPDSDYQKQNMNQNKPQNDGLKKQDSYNYLNLPKDANKSTQERVKNSDKPKVIRWPSTEKKEKKDNDNSSNKIHNMSHLSSENKNVNPTIMQEFIRMSMGHLDANDKKHATKKKTNFKENVEIKKGVQQKISDKISADSKKEKEENNSMKINKNLDPAMQDTSFEGSNEPSMKDDDVPNKRTFTRGTAEDQLRTISLGGWPFTGFTMQNMQYPRQMSNNNNNNNNRGSSDHSSIIEHHQEIVGNTKERKSQQSQMRDQSNMENMRNMDWQRVYENQPQLEYQQQFFNEPSSINDQQSYMPQRSMYEQYSQDPRLAGDGQPDVVYDKSPIKAILLPSSQDINNGMMPGRDFSMSYPANADSDQPQHYYQSQSLRTMDTSVLNADQGYNMPMEYYEQGPAQIRQYDYPEPTFDMGRMSPDQSQYAIPFESEPQTAFGRQHQELGEMGPQIMEHGRTIHPGQLFGIKKNLIKGTGSGYSSYGNHGGNTGYPFSYGFSHGYSQGYSQKHKGYYRDSDQSSQEASYQQHPSEGMDLMQSASSNLEEVSAKPEELKCSCSRSWSEIPPPPQISEYENDKRLENSTKLRSKRSVGMPIYYTSDADSVSSPVKYTPRYSPRPRRPRPKNSSNGPSREQSHLFQPIQKIYHPRPPCGTYFEKPIVVPYDSSSVIEPKKKSSSFQDPYVSTSHVESKKRSGPKIVSIAADHPLSMDESIQKQIAQHTEQAIREALEKVEAEPLQITSEQLATGDHDLNEPIVDMRNAPHSNYPSSDQSHIALPIQPAADVKTKYGADIDPAPSEHAMPSYLPQEFSDYHVSDSYSKSYDQPIYPVGRLPSPAPNPAPPKQQTVDPLDALRMFDQASKSGRTFHDLLDTIKEKLFSCCEKCKDKILRGIHQRIDDDELDSQGFPTKDDDEYSSSSNQQKSEKELTREIELLMYDILKEEKAQTLNNNRRRKSTNSKSIAEKKMKLQKLAHNLVDLKKCSCCSDEDVSDAENSIEMRSVEQGSLEMPEPKKKEKIKIRAKEGKSGSKKSRNGSRRKSKKKSSKVKIKAKVAEEEERGSSTALSDPLVQ